MRKRAGTLDRPLNYGAALRTIRGLWRSGEVVWTHHASARLRERNLIDLDIGHVILNGRITEHRGSIQGWKYTVEGRTVDGDQASCSVAIEGRLIIITVIG
jgi:hypothetical protein